MNRDEIIRMAREAGFGGTGSEFYMDALERFAALFEQHLIATGYRKCAENQHTTQDCGLLEQAVAAEREACARLVERQWETVGTQRRTAERCATAIRARGEG